MDSMKMFGFLVVLKESFRISCRSWKLMAFIATTSIILYSISYLLFMHSIKPLIQDLIIKSTYSLMYGVMQDMGLLLEIESLFVLACSFVSFLSATMTVYASAVYCCNKSLYLKDLLFRPLKSWARPFITSFHLSLLYSGFIFSVMFMLMPLLFISGSLVLKKSLLFVSVGIAVLFLIYLSVVWKLAFVISVVEENCYGNEALGKAEALVKGKRLHGYIIEFLFTMSYTIILLCLRLVKFKRSAVGEMILPFSLFAFISLVKVFQLVAYTMLYSHCKKNHGEDIELQGSIDYSKIPCDLPPHVNDMH